MSRIKEDLPDLFAWVQWSYHVAGELRFGNYRILSTAGVQQGDPLGPLLFSSVVSQFLDSVGSNNGLDLPLWYLDDGSFVGTRDSVGKFVASLVLMGPAFGLNLTWKNARYIGLVVINLFLSYLLKLHFWWKG